MAENNTADVTNIKGVRGGYGFSAPITVDPPTDFTALANTFANMGFISSDGISEEIDADTEEVTDLNGDVVFVAKSRESERLTFTLISKTVDSLKEIYGHGQVTSANDIITVRHQAINHDERVYVFDLLDKNSNKWRKVVPVGTVVEVGPIVFGAGNVYSREITLQCAPDEDGVRMYDYIEA